MKKTKEKGHVAKRVLVQLLIVSLIIAIPITSFAHSGRTDSRGGHRDNQNKSGLGYYHYHCGGNPPHLHNGGICPYSSGYANSYSSYYNSYQRVYATSISSSNVPVAIDAGDNMQLECTVFPANSVDDNITWISETPEIAEVSKAGKLKAIDVGTAIIIAKTERGTSRTFNILINEVIAEKIEIENKFEEILLEDCEYLEVKFSPNNTTYKDIEWQSSNEKVATITEDGKLYAISLGKTTITAKHKDLEDSFDIEVLPIKAKSVSIEVEGDIEESEESYDYSVKRTGSVILDAIVLPENTTDKTVKWSVDDNKIATISDDGTLVIKATGIVRIYAETENGKKDSISIRIYSNTTKIVIGSMGTVGALYGIKITLDKRKRKPIETENE